MDDELSSSQNFQDELNTSSTPHTPDLYKDSRGINRRILALALPSLGALVAEPIFTIVDSAMVGHLGTAELAGLGLASTVLQTIVGLFVFLLFSTTTLASRALGEGRPDKAIQSGIHTLWLATILGLVTTGILILFAEPILLSLGATAETLPHAHAYLRFSSPGLVGMFIVYAITGTLRGLQDTRTPFVVATSGALINIAANAYFIYILDMGVGGSGLGTAVTQSLMALSLLMVLARHGRQYKIRLAPSFTGILSAATRGAPLLIRTIALRLALLATLVAAASISTTALASHQIIWTIWSFMAFIFDAIAVAAQTLVGYAIGARAVSHLPALIKALVKWSCGSGIFLGLLLIVTSPWLPQIFSADSTLQNMTSTVAIIAGTLTPVAALAYILEGVLFGADEGRTLAVISAVNLALYVPILWIHHSLFAGSSNFPTRALAALWISYTAGYTAIRVLAYAYAIWWRPGGVLRSPL